MANQFQDAGESLVGNKRKQMSEAGGEFDVKLAKEWAAVPRLGQLVAQGPFIPCKRPLSQAANEKLEEGDR